MRQWSGEASVCTAGSRLRTEGRGNALIIKAQVTMRRRQLQTNLAATTGDACISRSFGLRLLGDPNNKKAIDREMQPGRINFADRA